MSDIQQFFGGGIKSIQRGSITVVAASTSNTATITAVAVAKTELRYLGSTGPVRLTLTNTTTITAARSDTSSDVTVSWELTERY